MNMNELQEIFSIRNNCIISYTDYSTIPRKPKKQSAYTQTKEITKSSQEGTKENETRATFIINEEQLTQQNFKHTQKQASTEDKVLSIKDAQELGVPYGTTESQARAMGINLANVS